MREEDAKFDRRRFLQTLAKAGTGACCCAPLAALGLTAQGTAAQGAAGGQEWIADLEGRLREGARTPAWRKMEYVERWISRVMDSMDARLDADTRSELMQACGRGCFTEAFGARSQEPPPAGALDRFLAAYQAAGETEIRREGDTIYYRYGPQEGNPYGLRLTDGYCMCPVVESGPARLSPTYCQCSAGYVRESFERLTGRPCRVQVLESLRTGGSSCRFRIDMQPA